jgi:hypothetical protein
MYSVVVPSLMKVSTVDVRMPWGKARGAVASRYSVVVASPPAPRIIPETKKIISNF